MSIRRFLLIEIKIHVEDGGQLVNVDQFNLILEFYKNYKKKPFDLNMLPTSAPICYHIVSSSNSILLFVLNIFEAKQEEVENEKSSFLSF